MHEPVHSVADPLLEVTLPRGPRVAGRWLLDRHGAEAVALLAGALVFGWRVGAPSPWIDEAATLAVTRRSVGDIVALVEHVDLVHAAFYLLAHGLLTLLAPVVTSTDGQLTAVRAISVLAMAGTAAALVSLGRRLGSAELGLAAAAVLIALPLASRWGQDARPFALVTLLAVLATSLLIDATARPDRWAGWARYGLCLTALTVVDLLGLLVVTAHAAYLLMIRPPGSARRWLASTAAGGLLASPLVLLATRQRDQVAWLTPPHLYDLTALYIRAFGSKLVPPLVVLAAAAVLVIGRGLPAGPAGRAFALGAAWCTAPPGLLWAVSARVPLFNQHYLLFTLPGLALLVAAEVAVLAGTVQGRRAAPVPGVRGRLATLAPVLVVPALAVLALPDQAKYRSGGGGHGEDVRAVAAYLTGRARPGDAVLFVPYTLRDVRQAYPDRFAGLDDVALAADPVRSVTLSGVDRRPEEIPAALAGHGCVWLITGNFDGFTTAQAVDRSKLAALDARYHAAERVHLDVLSVIRYDANTTPDNGRGA